MSNPEPGSVEYLETELERARQRVVAAKDAEYLKSPRLVEDVEQMKNHVGTVYGQPKPETIEEVVKAFINKYKDVEHKYLNALWAKG
jgi:hypothetical protein